ncbi:uncharacterized protein LOC122265736 [Penaeus japonicus]|uniref:uncharacterized protein LOC122265736 n=1 Tax=Penaeus japonicus TaxID=27405 RepID=UPI001C70B795|nr:uncharacterized protein LOC122265736 [Penaeus japonicus]
MWWAYVPWRGLLAGAVLLTLAGEAGVGGLYHPSPVVRTRYGSLRGLIATPNFGTLQPVAKYLGVPYAAPPVRKLRFMPPMSPLEWSGIRKAETLPPVCPQKLPDVHNRRDALRRMPEGRYVYLQRLIPLLQNQSEDCLYLNIYAPVRAEMPHFAAPLGQAEKYPVMVYIHGESYEWNSGNPYDGTVLAAYGRVIVVTVNFRLGILGFLRPALSEKQVSNFGLLDQIAALHWVRENIGNFGGDKERVTIVGHGTGAALANLLLISPVAQRELFNRAILMSGSALSRWAVTWDPYKYTIQVAKALECPITDQSSELVNCLRDKSVEELLNVRLNVPPFTTALGPIIDNIIVSDDPQKTMKKDGSLLGNYDLLYGVALAESYHMLTAREVEEGMTEERRNRLVRAYVNNNFKHHASQVYPTVMTHYQPWNRGLFVDGQMVRDQTLEILSDAQITAPVVQMANLHSNLNPKSYFYCFSHQSAFGDYLVDQGTVHGEELAYVFGAPLVSGFNHFGLNYTNNEKFLSELVMTHWSNFAKTGNPNMPPPQGFLTPGMDPYWRENLQTLWPQYGKLTQEYLNLDMKVVIKNHYRGRRLAVWNHLIPELVSASSKPYVPFLATPTPMTLVPTVRPRLLFTTPKWKPKSTYKPPETTPVPPPPPPPPEHQGTQSPSGPPPPPGYAGTPISIVILVGIAILFINCCAMGAVYYQRDKIKFQSKLLRRNFGFGRGNSEEDEEECVSEAPSLGASSKGERKRKKSRSDYEVSDSVHSDSVSRASAVSRESSSKRRQHSQSSRDVSPPSTNKHHETPKSSHKNNPSKTSKSGHRRHKSEVSIYSEIGRTADVHVHADASGSRSVSRSSSKRSPTVKFNTVGSGLPPKSVTKSTTSISSKASITSHASAKSTSSRASIKSTTSEKRLKKNASCQSLPTAEYTWGITKEMTMTEKDDPEGRNDQRTPADRHHTVAAMQKLNYPKVLPDHPDGMHAATLPKMRPPPPPRSTSLTAKDIQELEDKVHVVYRTKKRTPRRDASTDSCDLSGIDIYGVGGDTHTSPSLFGTPAPVATVNRSRSRKSDGAGDYIHSSDYLQQGNNSDFGRQGAPMDYDKAGSKTGEYGRKGTNDPYSRYDTYEPTYIYKDSRVASAPKKPATSEINNSNKTYETYGEARSPRVPLATFGKMGNHSPGDGASYTEKTRPRQNYDPSMSVTPSATAIVTAAAQTALATATAPAFVGASNPGRSNSRNLAPVPAATHTCALRQQSSVTSGSDTSTVYEQSENTGTIKRKKSLKKENSTNTSVSISTQSTTPNEKPLKGVLKQTSAYDKPKPLMAKAPGASPSASASSISSTEIGSGSSGNNAVKHDVAGKSSSLKRINRVATPGATRRKGKSDNQTSTDVQTEPAK